MIALLLTSLAGCLPAQAEPGPASVPATAPAPTGGGCASSCALDAAPTPAMTRQSFEDLLHTWASEPVGEPTLALETLLFQGPETRAWLQALGAGPLDEAHIAFLDQELDRDSVRIEMLVIDADGTERGRVEARHVGLAEKQHLTFSGTGSLGHLETGGKVKRVGLGHLWSRW